MVSYALIGVLQRCDVLMRCTIHARLCRVILPYATLCYAMLNYVVLRYGTIYYAVLLCFTVITAILCSLIAHMIQLIRLVRLI